MTGGSERIRAVVPDPGERELLGVDEGAAAFAIQGQAGGNVNITFTLPSTIASGGATLPIAAWTARRSATNSPGSGTDFVPSATATSAAIGGGGALSWPLLRRSTSESPVPSGYCGLGTPS